MTGVRSRVFYGPTASAGIFSRLPKPPPAISEQKNFAPIKHTQEVRQKAIARVGQFIKRELTICFTGAPAHECQLAVVWSARVPFQEIVDPGWLAVFVDTKDTDIEIKARILEIVGIAAEKSHLLFRGEDQTDVVVTFVTIKM